MKGIFRRFRFNFGPTKSIFLLKFIALFCWSMVYAQERTVTIDIPSQVISKALEMFAEQTDISLIFSTESVGTTQTGHIKGQYVLENALAMLLEDTGLGFKETGEGIIAISKVSSAVQASGDQSADVQPSTTSGHLAERNNGEKSNSGTEEKDSLTFMLQDVVVTAQRREETLQETPITVTAINSASLERQNIRSLFDLTYLAPGLQMSKDIGKLQVQMRGISTQDLSPAAENPVAIHVDDIYLTGRVNLSGFFFDVERVEVLQGPQGTLYGRNSPAGALNIITKRPAQELQGNIELEYGNYNRVRSSGMMNIPLTDRLAIRAAFQTHRHEGYFESGLGDTDEKFVRLSAQWDITDNMSLYMKGDYGTIDEIGSGSGIYGNISDGDPVTPELEPVFTEWDADPFDDSIMHPTSYWHPYDSVHYAHNRSDSWGIMGEFTWAFDWGGTAIINASHREQEDDFNYAYSGAPQFGRNGQITAFTTISCFLPTGCIQPDGSVVPFRAEYLQTPADPTQTDIIDARLQGTSFNETLEWVAGVFWFEQETADFYENISTITQTMNFGYDLREMNIKASAVYGQATWTIFDRLHITGGLRYTKDEKDWIFDVSIPIPPCGGLACTLVQNMEAAEWSNTNYRIGLAYDITDDIMVYVNNATGFRSGSYYGGAIPFYDPEENTAWEAGIKSTLLDGRLRINADVYDWDYEGMTIRFYLWNNLRNDDEGTIGNAGVVKVKGGNLSADFLATEDDLLHLAVEFTESTIEEFDLAGVEAKVLPFYDFIPPNLKGVTLANVPKWRFTGSWMHTFHLANAATIDARAQFHWESGRWMSYQPDMDNPYFPGAYQESFHQTDFQITYHPADGGWHVSGYVHNITDERIWTSLVSGPEAVTDPDDIRPLGSNYATGGLRAPLTFGIRFGYTF